MSIFKAPPKIEYKDVPNTPEENERLRVWFHVRKGPKKDYWEVLNGDGVLVLGSIYGRNEAERHVDKMNAEWRAKNPLKN